MPILIDDREGSKELADWIPDAVLVTMDFGDAAFDGNGPDGPISIGIERKKIRDLVNSIATGRLSGHQVPGLLKEYGKVYLVVEGRWKEAPDGGLMVQGRMGWKKLEQGKREYSWVGINHYLHTLEAAGILIRMTPDMRATCDAILALKSWWSKPWRSHHGLDVIYRPLPAQAALSPQEVNLVMRVASVLRHVGWARAKAVAKRFPTVEDMVVAEEHEWCEVEGIGATIARRIFRAIHVGEET